MGIVSRFQQWRGARILIGNFKSLHRYLRRNGWDFKGDAERQILCGRSVPNEVGEDVSFEIGYTEMNMYAVMTLNLDVPQERVAEIAELEADATKNVTAGAASALSKLEMMMPVNVAESIRSKSHGMRLFQMVNTEVLR